MIEQPACCNCCFLQVWASLLLYRQILDEIEANDYNNFTRRAYVPKTKKLMALPKAYLRSLVPPSSSQAERQRHYSSLTQNGLCHLRYIAVNDVQISGQATCINSNTWLACGGAVVVYFLYSEFWHVYKALDIYNYIILKRVRVNKIE